MNQGQHEQGSHAKSLARKKSEKKISVLPGGLQSPTSLFATHKFPYHLKPSMKKRQNKIKGNIAKSTKNAPGGVRTRDLRITSAPSVAMASTAYKYDALTDCATGATCIFAVMKCSVEDQFSFIFNTGLLNKRPCVFLCIFNERVLHDLKYKTIYSLLYFF